MSERRPILCLDFDGVIHSYMSGWQGAGIASDPPVAGAAEFLYAATLEQGFDVSVLSSRSGQPYGIECMRRYVFALLDDEYGGNVTDAVMFCIDFPRDKPAAFLTIDDRALTFDGTWPDPASLKAFKPWNRRTAP